jgi:hypothetical protein
MKYDRAEDLQECNVCAGVGFVPLAVDASDASSNCVQCLHCKPASIIQPCPFCSDPDLALDEVEAGVWAVRCSSCGATGPRQEDQASAGVHTRAIDAWNKRIGAKQ